MGCLRALRAPSCPFHLLTESSLQSSAIRPPYVSLVQVRTGPLIRGQISGTMDSQGGCSVWGGVELEQGGKKEGEKRTDTHTHTHANIHTQGMEILAGFAKGGGVHPAILVYRLYWRAAFPPSCQANLYNSDFQSRFVFLAGCKHLCLLLVKVFGKKSSRPLSNNRIFYCAIQSRDCVCVCACLCWHYTEHVY